MIQDIEKIEYRKGTLSSGMKILEIIPKTIAASEISREIYKAAMEADILSCQGSYGERTPGGPTEVDHVKIFLPEKTVEIAVYNRKKSVSEGDESLKRIDRFITEVDGWKKR